MKAQHNEASSLVAQMTTFEKVLLCSGRNFWYTQACERLQVASVMVTDGPHGLRKQDSGADHVGLNASVPATCFPTASGLASTWNRRLLVEVGGALGQQCVAEDVALLLGPGMNIKRHPLCGRNFEYFSEDPLLTGELAAAVTRGIQSQGVGACVKHFAANNQEQARMTVDVIVDERTLREIYLRGFEIAITKSQPWAVMCAYNRLNGLYCSDHNWLLNDVLRGEWQFEGLVVTDWGAMNERVDALHAGLDLEMPGSGGVNNQKLLQAHEAGQLSEDALDQAAIRITSLALLGQRVQERKMESPATTHHQLAIRAAAESAVLLKNDGLLPLKRVGSVGVIGEFAKQPRYQGTGSSQVNPTQLDCAFDELWSLWGTEVDLSYAPGYDANNSPIDEALLEQAAAMAAQVDRVVVFVGLPASYESEGFDRLHMNLPEQHDRLVEAVAQANDNVVVVLSNGAPVQMPWIDKINAVLEMYLSGQGGGAAVARLLTGLDNPSGKLAETFPLALSDVPADQWFPGEHRQVQYREGLYVGYRYFASANVPVLFPFGHGLSYTQFDYEQLQVAEGAESISIRLTNTGAMQGAEVVQVYVTTPITGPYRAARTLAGFEKIALAPTESTTVQIHLDANALCFYNTSLACWSRIAGEFEFQVGASSVDIRLQIVLELPGEAASAGLDASGSPAISASGLSTTDASFGQMLGRDIPAPEPVQPFHLNSTLNEISVTAIGKRMKAGAVAGFKKSMGVENVDPVTSKMFDEMANQMPLRSLVLFARGRLSFAAMEQTIALLNKNYFTAFKLYLKNRKQSKIRRQT